MKMFKKLLTVVLSVLMISAVATIGVTAEESVEYKPLLNDDRKIKSEFKEAGETHYYTVTFEEPTYLGLRFSNESSTGVFVDGLLYMEGLENPMLKFCEKVDYNYSYRDKEFYLEKGTYYLHLTAQAPVDYEMKTTVRKLNNQETEPNNNNAIAHKLQKDTPIIGAITLTDRVDVYEFTLEKRSLVQFDYYNTGGLDIEHVDGQYHKYNYLYREYEYEYSEGILEDVGWEDGYKEYVLDEGTYYITVSMPGYSKGKQYKLSYNTYEAPPVFVEYGTYRGNESTMKRTDTKLSVIDGKVKEWSVSDKKILKISKISEKSIKVLSLQKGTAYVNATLENGKTIQHKIIATQDPEILNTKYKPIKSVKVKKGKKVTVRISNKQNGIRNKYTNSKYAKITSIGNSTNVKIKGIKVGTSYVKIKVNGVKTLKLKVKVTK